MGAKGQTVAKDILELLLDGTAFTDIDTTSLVCCLGTGTPDPATGQLGNFSSVLGEATFQTSSASGNWTFAAVGGTSRGSKATSGVAVGDGSTEWENTNTSTTIAVTEIAIYKAGGTGGAVPAVSNLLYSGAVTGAPVNVGAGAFVTIASGGLVITEE